MKTIGAKQEPDKPAAKVKTIGGKPPVFFDVLQGSEEWDNLRRGKATASCFGRIVTPKTLKFGSGAKTYACEKVAEILGVDSTDHVPSKWMDHGTDMEQYARKEMEKKYETQIAEIGFAMPGKDSRHGCSPDGLSPGVLWEFKCPKPETLIKYHAEGVLPSEYRIQVQGSLNILKLPLCRFVAWHPMMEPFIYEARPDMKVFEALDTAIPMFTDMVDDILGMVKKRESTVPVFSMDGNEMVTFEG